jgi:hypothetical protein
MVFCLRGAAFNNAEPLNRWSEEKNLALCRDLGGPQDS